MNFKCKYVFHFKFLIDLFFTVTAIALYFQANSQTFSSKTFTTDNGLSHNFVQHIAQDQTGFLWISTWDGLSRFDGYEFRNYYHKPEDSTSVPFFVIDKTVVDKLNNVWVFCQNRPVVIYNRNTDTFNPFRSSEFNEQYICDITAGIDSSVWMYSLVTNKLYQYESDKRLLSTFRLIDENGSNRVVFNYAPQVLIDNNGGVWFFSICNSKYEVYKGELTGENMIQLRSMNSLPVIIDGEPSDYKSLAMYDINISDTGDIFLFSKFGLFYFDPILGKFVKSTGEISKNHLSGKPFYYWSDAKTGIHIIDTRQNEIVSLKPESGKFTESLFVDSQENIWSGDINESWENIGLTRYIKTPDYFKNYLYNKGKITGNSKREILSTDKNCDTWLAFRGFESVFCIDPNGAYKKFDLPSDNGKHFKINSMALDSLGIWLGCTGNRLFYFDFANEKFTQHLLMPEGGAKETNMAIHNILLNKNEIIINGGKAIYKYNIANFKLTTEYWHVVNNPSFCMIKDENNGYWIGLNSNTIKHLDSNFKEISTYRINSGLTNVEHICLGDNNDIWVALMGGGLGHSYPDSGKTEAFTTANGIANNTLSNILKDKNGNLWISTNKGISRFNTQTRYFRNFGKADGLLTDEFSSDASYLSPNGEMFFGGIGGMLSFFPDSVDKNSTDENTGQLVITDFKVSGVSRFFEKPIYELDTAILLKGDNNFQLTFSMLDFKNSEKLKYRYRLTGKNKLWTETDYRQRNLNYANLNPGIHKIEIEATNSFGEWYFEKSLHVFIPSFYYQNLWFKVLIIAILALFATIGIFVYNRQIRLNAKQKQNELRLESLRGQMNPHFIFNALNSVNYFISNNDKFSANSYIADFSRLIRSILNNLSYDFISMDKELESIRDYLRLEHLRFSDKFDYKITVELENHSDISVFPGLVQPFIENAIWHGVRGLDARTGFIKVVFEPVDSNKIRCIVEDDGIGRKQAEKYKNVLPGKKSRGIGIVEERLKIISEIRKVQYKVIFEDILPDKQDTGTRVVIDLPIKKSKTG